ncbi:MAG: hypothetical protein KI792_08055 [Alphaproteobacteria bacterium]|nr:hypothetical protein [Alphaproteobacteria bacterium SS10]
MSPLAERRALGYPYACNYQPFVVTGGGFLAPRTEPWPEDISWRRALEGRHASLAIGSNRSTNQLARKYIGWPEPLAIPAWPVRAIGLDVHFAAAIGHYGAIPATPVRASGTSCDLMLVWLNPSERVRMDETEALGHAYDRYTLPVDCTDLPVAVSEVDVYVHRAGTYPLTGRQSVAMKELPVSGALDAHAGRLTQRMMQERLRRRYAPSISLQQFVGGNIHNAPLRRSRAALMGQRAVPAWSPKLTDGAAHHDDVAGVLGGCAGTAGGQFPRVRLVSMA